ncbi:MAG: ferrous iron transport protein B, partial [Deltaproteobacteria bacterium]|nr:ferrous iron transport protein B [Deltaproteobacteria bacterium]
QLLELNVPLVLAFNMSDEAKARGYEFDLERLSEIFSAPIVPTVGHKGQGMAELLTAIAATAAAGPKEREKPLVDYGPEIEAEIGKVEKRLAEVRAVRPEQIPAADRYNARRLAVALLEEDKELAAEVPAPEIRELLRESAARIEKRLGESPATAIAGRRYGVISGACREAVRSTIELRHTLSDRIDAVLTNRILGLPIFLGLMYLVFQLTFTLGEPPMGWIENGFSWLAEQVSRWWPEGSESALRSLFLDGIIGGVGGVIVFLPNILLLFLAIAFLEDTGYMARAAFLMDRLMHRMGLQGKSFIPMLVGFGCSVPAIMATRTLENRRDRLATMLVIPLMSCGARLPIYALIIPAFFSPMWQGPVLWLIYIIGIALAVLAAKLLRMTLLKGESVPLVMELPPYRLPTLRGIAVHMGERGWLYLKKAGTVILGVSILLWAMTSYPQKTVFDRDYETERTQAEQAYLLDKAEVPFRAALTELEQAQKGEEMAYSLAGRIGQALEPLIRPMGFDWRIGTALIGALAAKEVFVAQLGIVYALGEAGEDSASLRAVLRSQYSPLVAFCIMLFCLISAPCMATIAVCWRESQSWKWALFQLGGLTLLAYGITVLVYQSGRLLGIGLG